MLQRRAMERATQLILDICGGEAGPVTEAVEHRGIAETADSGSETHGGRGAIGVNPLTWRNVWGC